MEGTEGKNGRKRHGVTGRVESRNIGMFMVEEGGRDVRMRRYLTKKNRTPGQDI